MPVGATASESHLTPKPSTSSGDALSGAVSSVEETLRLIRELATKVPSSSSFESADIARQIAEQAELLRQLRNALVHYVPSSTAEPAKLSNSSATKP